MRSNFTSKALALLAFIISFANYKANASHYAAVDISVQYAGTGSNDLTYKVMVDIYFACQGGAAPNSAGDVYYFSKNEGGRKNVPYQRFQPDPTDDNRSVNCQQVGPEIIVDQLCDQYKNDNSCTRDPNLPLSPFPGFKLWHNEGMVTLSSRQSDWVFWWDGNARNTGILNLASPGTIFVDAGLDNLVKHDNSTPKFTSSPLPYLCQNQSALYLTSPVGLMGDSLVVNSVVPREGPTSFCSYDNVNGYTAANPIASASSNPYLVNTYTGVASFSPTKTGLFVLAFRVDKYDRKTGKRTGFANRDVQVTVMDCMMLQFPVTGPQNLPATSSYSSSTGILSTYAGYNLGFNVSAASPVPARLLYMESNVGLLPGASLTVTGNGTDTLSAAFSWTPDSTQIGDHILSITINDSTCDATAPIINKNHKVMLLRVLPAPDTSTGVKHIVHTQQFTIAPNPTNDIVSINSEHFLSGDFKIDLINSIGQVVYTGTTTRNAQQLLSLEMLSSGMYIIQLKNAEGNVYRQKVVKQ